MGVRCHFIEFNITQVDPKKIEVSDVFQGNRSRKVVVLTTSLSLTKCQTTIPLVRSLFALMPKQIN